MIAKHQAKVYGKASVGAPPMSVPHIDSRVINGEKQFVDVKYKLLDDNTYGFKLEGKYNEDETLIIDPIPVRWASSFCTAIIIPQLSGARNKTFFIFKIYWCRYANIFIAISIFSQATVLSIKGLFRENDCLR